jgi:hypothetical protein
LVKRKQAEADAFNEANFPDWAKYLHAKPKLPPRRRPRRLPCPVCKFPFVVKARGPIPVTCSPRCAKALALYQAFQRGINRPLDLLNKDIAANSFLAARRGRHQTIIDDMLSDIGVPRRTRRRRTAT